MERHKSWTSPRKGFTVVTSLSTLPVFQMPKQAPLSQCQMKCNCGQAWRASHVACCNDCIWLICCAYLNHLGVTEAEASYRNLRLAVIVCLPCLPAGQGGLPASFISHQYTIAGQKSGLHQKRAAALNSWCALTVRPKTSGRDAWSIAHWPFSAPAYCPHASYIHEESQC